MTMITGVADAILHFYRNIEKDQHHRYRSWEHCFSFFQKLHNNNSAQLADTAALQLAFYLASWGMYRGSSKLLQKDYRVHVPIVHEVMEEKYNLLWKISFDNPETNETGIALLFQLSDAIARLYSELKVSPTTTLVTKVILGVLGRVPAYDSLFIKGVIFWNQSLSSEEAKFPARFGEASYRGLIKFYKEHKEEFLEAQTYTEKQGIAYPIMKLADMYFWTLGFQLANKSQ